MSERTAHRFGEEVFIRHKVYGGKASALSRYMDLVIGERSYRRLLVYELVTLFGPAPGALGLLLRQRLYPLLFRKVGQGVVFGRNLTIRNAQNIVLGDRVLIDDYALLDGRGAGGEGFVIGDDSIVNRGVSIQSKQGPVHIGARCDIGAHTGIVSLGGVQIGDDVSVGGWGKLGGGLLSKKSAPGSSELSFKSSKGPIRIGDRVALARDVMVLDGVEIGAEAVVGARVTLSENVPAGVVVTAPQRTAAWRPGEEREEKPAPPAVPTPPPAAAPAASDGAVLEALYEALEVLNETLPPAQRLAPSPQTPLKGRLDSMSLLNFILAAEEGIESRFGVAIQMASAEAADLDPDPLVDVASVARYIEARLAEERRG